MRTLLALFLLPLTLSGCITAGTQGGIALAESRSIGTTIDDNAIYLDINRLYALENDSFLFAGTTINVRQGRVMLTGNIHDEARARRAVELAWQAKSVKEVINELVVNPSVPLSSEANDALIKKNLESRLLITKNVWVINYSLDVVNGTAYMLGTVKDQGEMDRALNVARTTKGVKRVVNYLRLPAPLAPINTDPVSGSYAPPTYGSGAVAPPSSAPAASSTAYSGASAAGADGTYANPDAISATPLPPASH